MLLELNIAFTVFILLNVFVKNTKAYRAPLPPGEDGKCFHHGDKLEVGKHFRSKPCQSVTCQEDGTVLVESCLDILSDHCKQSDEVELISKPFPDCCPVYCNLKRLLDRLMSTDDRKLLHLSGQQVVEATNFLFNEFGSESI